MSQNAHLGQAGLCSWTRNEYLVTVGWNSLNVGWNFSCNEMVIRRLMLRRYMTFTNVTWSWNDSIRVTKWPFNNYIFHKTDCTYPLHENYLWRHLGHFFSKKFEFTHSPSTQPLYNHQHPTQPQHHHISPKNPPLLGLEPTILSAPALRLNQLRHHSSLYI